LKNFISIEFPKGKFLEFPVNKIIRNSFLRSGKKLVRDLRSEMQKPKTGKIYIINGKSHVASSSKEAPASQTGRLLKSVRQTTRGNDLIFGAGNGSINYAKYLELGTRKMKERPFVFQTVKNNFKNIENDIGISIERLI
jgi:HK97 gp10 family phage protein